MDQNYWQGIAHRLHQRRLALGFSLQQLSDRAGLSRSTLQRYETGAIRSIPLSSIMALCVALQVTPQWLLGEPAPPAQPPQSSQLLESLNSRPELAQLLELAVGCAPADVRRLIQILRVLADDT